MPTHRFLLVRSTNNLLEKMQQSDLSYKELSEKVGRAKSAVWRVLHEKRLSGIMNRKKLRSDIAKVLTE